jgi:hypothetical protein
LLILLQACAAPARVPRLPSPEPQAEATPALPAARSTPQSPAFATPLPTRTIFGPGEKLPYVTQNGDTLEVLAVRFNTTGIL